MEPAPDPGPTSAAPIMPQVCPGQLTSECKVIKQTNKTDPGAKAKGDLVWRLWSCGWVGFEFLRQRLGW